MKTTTDSAIIQICDFLGESVAFPTHSGVLADRRDFFSAGCYIGIKQRVVVADDNADALRQMVRLLETEFEIIAAAENGQTALDCIQRLQPDVVVLDLKMPILDGVEISRELGKLIPRPAIVICSIEDDPEIIGAALRSGALGYVFKMCMTDDLVKAVRFAARGESFISSS